MSTFHTPPAAIEFAQQEHHKAMGAKNAAERIAKDVCRYLADQDDEVAAGELLAGVCRIVDSYVDGYAHDELLARSTVQHLGGEL